QDGLTVKPIGRQLLDAAVDRPSFPVLDDCDVVVNSAGVIKPLVKEVGLLTTLRVNSVFPHLLADFCIRRNKKCVHITTDCVFAGTGGRYDERSPHAPLDVYGKTKSLAAPASCTVLRTSISGEGV